MSAELIQAVMYRREFKEEYLRATCGRCLVPLGLAGLAVDAPCLECGSLERMDWERLDSLRNDSMDVYLEHQQEMTTYVRKKMLSFGFRYREEAVPPEPGER